MGSVWAKASEQFVYLDMCEILVLHGQLCYLHRLDFCEVCDLGFVPLETGFLHVIPRYSQHVFFAIALPPQTSTLFPKEQIIWAQKPCIAFLNSTTSALGKSLRWKAKSFRCSVRHDNVVYSSNVDVSEIKPSEGANLDDHLKAEHQLSNYQNKTKRRTNQSRSQPSHVLMYHDWFISTTVDIEILETSLH